MIRSADFAHHFHWTKHNLWENELYLATGSPPFCLLSWLSLKLELFAYSFIYSFLYSFWWALWEDYHIWEHGSWLQWVVLSMVLKHLLQLDSIKVQPALWLYSQLTISCLPVLITLSFIFLLNASAPWGKKE